MPELFGAKVCHLRVERELTQVELARALGLSTQSPISLLESQYSPPSLALLVRMAYVLGVTTDYLLRDNIPVAAVADHLRVPAPPPAAPLHQFGTKLRELRTQQGLKMNQLAAQLGLTSHSHLSHLESGRKEPSLTLVLQLAERRAAALASLNGARSTFIACLNAGDWEQIKEIIAAVKQDRGFLSQIYQQRKFSPNEGA
jgi:transcriptional regulator with XRE-family HTH domain